MIKSISLEVYTTYNETIKEARMNTEKVIREFDIKEKDWDKLLLMHESITIRSIYLNYLELWLMEQDNIDRQSKIQII
jgi:hypothetical protein